MIHPTNSFYSDVDILCEELGAAAEAVLKDLGKAVETLQRAPADPPVESHGWRGDTFAYPIGDRFVLVFRLATDRDEYKRPTLIHLYLKRVIRRG